MGGKAIQREEIEQILADVATGMTFVEACAKAERDSSAIWKHIWRDPELSTQYQRAQDEGVDARLDKAFARAETEQDVNRARLIADNAKWWASKRRAKQYGDKIEQHITSDEPKSHEDMLKAIRELEQRLGLTNSEQGNQQGRAPSPKHDVRARDAAQIASPATPLQ